MSQRRFFQHRRGLDHGLSQHDQANRALIEIELELLIAVELLEHSRVQRMSRQMVPMTEEESGEAGRKHLIFCRRLDLRGLHSVNVSLDLNRRNDGECALRSRSN